MQIGDQAALTRVFTDQDLAGYEALAQGGDVAHGLDHVPEPLIAALFSYLLGVKLPGPGTNYLKQEIGFLARADLGQEITASVEVTRLRPEKQIVDLWAKAELADGTVIAEGRSLVKYADTGHGGG
ncbi:phosphate acetyltransferase [Tropicibacter sp. R15_0]|uniref:phosphate acetyltransferase n=1 Tax=Tropicibacter sp. R15_0 TaxID=2821101 RepID=UPI001ADB92BD|nr:phosphate acetyltransferase [Tropicibacter sp. R15_0]MBO9467906.1 phosphate acetyltransferase [Tropicibacter sp. R15_0]